MILKELEPFQSTDKLARAGRAAEEQMAFYLRRKFATSPDVRVFNNIRLEKNGDAAQIDHLVLYKHGVIIIESKSVTSEVKINAQGSGLGCGMVVTWECLPQCCKPSVRVNSSHTICKTMPLNCSRKY